MIITIGKEHNNKYSNILSNQEISWSINEI